MTNFDYKLDPPDDPPEEEIPMTEDPYEYEHVRDLYEELYENHLDEGEDRDR